HINGPATAIASTRRRVGDYVAAHSPRAQPSLDIVFQNRMVLMRMAAAAVNDPDAREPGAEGFKQEFLEYESGILQVQAVQIEMSLDRKTARPQIVEIQASVRVNRSFNVFGRVLDFDIAFPDEFFECAQSVLLFILSLDFNGRAIVKRNSAPS